MPGPSIVEMRMRWPGEFSSFPTEIPVTVVPASSGVVTATSRARKASDRTHLGHQSHMELSLESLQSRIPPLLTQIGIKAVPYLGRPGHPAAWTPSALPGAGEVPGGSARHKVPRTGPRSSAANATPTARP
jgi:hypothetical protein